MFTVGLDTSALDHGFKEHAARGIGRYVTELTSFFSKYRASQAGGQFDETSSVGVDFFRQEDIGEGGLVNRCISKLPVGRVTVKQQILYPFRLNSGKLRSMDVLHFPAHMDAPSWCRKPCIVTVLDLIPLIFKDLYLADRPSWRFHLARWLEIQAIRNAKVLLAISECTARDVVRLLKIPRERIVVTPLGVDDSFFHRSTDLSAQHELRARLGIAQEQAVLLYVGGIDQRKNWPALLETFARVRAHSARNVVLLMVGKIQSDRQYPKLLKLIEELRLTDSVILPGYLNHADLLNAYALSSAFIFLSLYEGFGLPVLEAMAAGLPVVCSNTSSLPEVVEGAALMSSPHDTQQAAEQVLAILNNEALSTELAARGRAQAAKYPWRRCGELTLEAYEQVAFGKRGAASEPMILRRAEGE